MPKLTVNLSCPFYDSFRVQQVLGMFDMPSRPTLAERFTVDLPSHGEPWQIGVIVGPTGSGKTAVARKAYGRQVYGGSSWPAGRAVIDCFGDHPIREITQMLTLVGFSSPPAWIKPFSVLSNGEKFRCELARAFLRDRNEQTRDHGDAGTPGNANRHGVEDAEILQARHGNEMHTKRRNAPCFPAFPHPGVSASSASRHTDISPIVVMDEFTSLVDRTVARVGSTAISRAIRGGKIDRRFVAVTCHEDIVPWLEPDWVLNMASQTLSREQLRRPDMRLVIQRCNRDKWPLFQRHHYLSGNLHKAAQCFLGTIDNRPAVFTAVLPFPHPLRSGWREHRTVCLPDFQGVGVGSAMSAYIASLFVATGKPYFSTSGHPAVVHSRAMSPLWKMLRGPSLSHRIGKTGAGKTGMGRTLAAARFTAGFEYVGPGRPTEARELGVSSV